MRGSGARATRAIAALGRCTFPGYCALCGTAVSDGFFCSGCLHSLPRAGAACERCATPLSVPLPDGVPCGDCQAREPLIVAARAALRYTFPVDAALKALKFRRQLHYVPAFASLLRPIVGSFPAVDALAPVPLHRWRHAVRGFNQANELAKPLARGLGLPIVRGVRRIRRTRPQTGLSAAERRRNLADAFAVTGRLECRHPLVVDDVMTTGETCRQLAAALLFAGAEQVSVLTVARAAQAPAGRKV